MDVEEFRALCETHKDKLAALMVTYPSTRAFFEDNIQEICQIVHDNGGQVYMDGANMNAQLGLTSPGTCTQPSILEGTPFFSLSRFGTGGSRPKLPALVSCVYVCAFCICKQVYVRVHVYVPLMTRQNTSFAILAAFHREALELMASQLGCYDAMKHIPQCELDGLYEVWHIQALDGLQYCCSSLEDADLSTAARVESSLPRCAAKASLLDCGDLRSAGTR